MLGAPPGFIPMNEGIINVRSISSVQEHREMGITEQSQKEYDEAEKREGERIRSLREANPGTYVPSSYVSHSYLLTEEWTGITHMRVMVMGTLFTMSNCSMPQFVAKMLEAMSETQLKEKDQ